jgi:hypothetical protein
MNSKRPILFFLMIGILLSINVKADIYDDIALAVKNGNYKEVARYFNTRVELKIGDAEDIYSKSQAEMILRDFFAKNPAVNFTIKHKGASAKGLPYIIGDYQASTGNFRTYFLFKQEGTTLFIQELHFDRE